MSTVVFPRGIQTEVRVRHRIHAQQRRNLVRFQYETSLFIRDEILLEFWDEIKTR